MEFGLWVQNPGEEFSPKWCPLPPPEHRASCVCRPFDEKINSPVCCAVRGLKGEVGGRGWWGSPECLDEAGEWGTECTVTNEKRRGNLCWADGEGEAVLGVAVVTAQVQDDKKHCEGCGITEEVTESQFPAGTPQALLCPWQG